jgi:hypothetical protein
MPQYDFGHSRIMLDGWLRPVRTVIPKPEYLGGPMDENSNVEPWVQKMVEETLGTAPVEIGKEYQHPIDGRIRIVSGQYWGKDGLSNHWSWKVLRTGDIKSGYGESWPEAESADGAKMRHPAGKRLGRDNG